MRIKNPMMNEKPVIPMRYDFARAGKNGTLIAVIMDESGSMSSVQNQTIAAFNEFVLGQKNSGKETGAAYMTLVKFDAPDIHTVFSNRPIEEVPDLNKQTYAPRGGTNLLDAVGHTLAKVQNELTRHANVEDRPGVIVLIMTDGEENNSHQYTRDEIKKMVKSAEKSDWTFTFLGANIDAFAAGAQLGMGVHNTLQYNVHNMGGTMSAASEMVASTRIAKMKGLNTQELYASGLYSDDQRNKAK